MIVLNGEPFLKYNLRSLYPFAHQLIIVEGAVPGARAIADANGHSTDQTLSILREFESKEDPENKVTILTAEDAGYPDGFWQGEKDEQSRQFAVRATGDFLWQVDVDEFYKPQDVQVVMDLLTADNSITAVSFPMLTFWGGFNYIADGWYLRRGASTYHRLFKWDANYTYHTHRPPTVLNENGENTRSLHWINSDRLSEMGVFLYHYSLIFPSQVQEKVTYYENADWSRRTGAKKWMENSFLQLKNPFRVHNVYRYPSWLKRFRGTHPPQVLAMQDELLKNTSQTRLRQVEDIERLLANPLYRIATVGLILLDYVDRARLMILSVSKKILKNFIQKTDNLSAKSK